MMLEKNKLQLHYILNACYLLSIAINLAHNRLSSTKLRRFIRASRRVSIAPELVLEIIKTRLYIFFFRKLWEVFFTER